MIEHTCELPLKQENQFSYVLTKPLTFKNVWTVWCSISKYTPKCGVYMDSLATITAERRRHAGLKHWWIIHPFSYARFLWDALMTAVYLIAFFTIPFMICFVVMDYELIRLDKVNIPIYTICWLDILFNCITGFYDKRNISIELKPTKIFLSYLNKFLIPDVLSSLPYDHITLSWRRLPGNDPYYYVTLINIMPFMKLTRYYTLKSNIYYLFMHFEIKNFYFQLYTTLLLGLYLIFWFSCLCYLMPILVIYFLNISPAHISKTVIVKILLHKKECEDCWMMRLENSGYKIRFKSAAFIALENILASGYGLFVPTTNSTIILNSILMIIGRCIVCYILVMFLHIKAERKSSEVKFQEIMDQVKAYTRQKQLLPHMKKRLLLYYHYRFKNSYFRSKQILSDLTEPLREEIALESCRRLIENVMIFKNLPKDILQSIVKNLKFELYLPNDVIVKAGTQGDCMFFLSSGTVAVLTPTGKEMCHLEDGAHFGEVALLVADQRRIASVIAIDVCEVYRLDRKDFRHCIDVHSELFAEIERIATERVEKTVRVEKQYKRFLTRPSAMQNARQREREESKPMRTKI